MQKIIAEGYGITVDLPHYFRAYPGANCYNTNPEPNLSFQDIHHKRKSGSDDAAGAPPRLERARFSEPVRKVPLPPSCRAPVRGGGPIDSGLADFPDGLSDWAAAIARRLSGGMESRVCMAIIP